MSLSKKESELTENITENLDLLFEESQLTYIVLITKLFANLINDLKRSEANLPLEKVKSTIHKETGLDLI
jgi:hypothetical protein